MPVFGLWYNCITNIEITAVEELSNKQRDLYLFLWILKIFCCFCYFKGISFYDLRNITSISEIWSYLGFVLPLIFRKITSILFTKFRLDSLVVSYTYLNTKQLFGSERFLIEIATSPLLPEIINCTIPRDSSLELLDTTAVY